MAKVLKSPAKYVQGANTLFEFDRYLQGMGKRLTVILRCETAAKYVGKNLCWKEF